MMLFLRLHICLVIVFFFPVRASVCLGKKQQTGRTRVVVSCRASCDDEIRGGHVTFASENFDNELIGLFSAKKKKGLLTGVTSLKMNSDVGDVCHHGNSTSHSHPPDFPARSPLWTGGASVRFVTGCNRVTQQSAESSQESLTRAASPQSRSRKGKHTSGERQEAHFLPPPLAPVLLNRKWSCQAREEGGGGGGGGWCCCGTRVAGGRT